VPNIDTNTKPRARTKSGRQPRKAKHANRIEAPHVDHSADVLLDHLAFARDDVTGRLVDVRDVSRGLACHCSCVSCGEQLVARKGDVIAWHFAHTANSSCSKVAKEGSLDAIDAMVRQLIMENPAIELPSYFVSEKILEPGSGKVHTIICPVAPISRLRFEKIAATTDPSLKKSGLSFVAEIDGYRLGIVLARKQSSISSWSGIPDPKLGVLVFDLSYPADASGANGESEISIARLANWISGESGGKTWVQHPRETIARAKASRRRVAGLRRALRQQLR